MFERYTEKARRSIFFARYEASMYGSPQIGTEHLLLGLLREDQALLGAHPPVEPIRKWIQDHVGPRGEPMPTSVDLPLNQECKRALMLGVEEATNLGHEKIGTGHLLLGIAEVEACAVAAVLREYGFSADALRAAVASKAAETAPADSLVGLLPKSSLDRARAASANWGAIAALSANVEARKMYSRAVGEARKLNSPCLDTKHLLLALVEGFDVKGCFGLDAAAIREQIKPEPPRRERLSVAMISPTDELRQALQYAVDESGSLGDKHLGPEHLVLGLLREEAGEASEILRANGLSLDQARRAVAAFRDRGSESEGSHYV